MKRHKKPSLAEVVIIILGVLMSLGVSGAFFYTTGRHEAHTYLGNVSYAMARHVADSCRSVETSPIPGCSYVGDDPAPGCWETKGLRDLLAWVCVWDQRDIARGDLPELIKDITDAFVSGRVSLNRINVSVDANTKIVSARASGCSNMQIPPSPRWCGTRNSVYPL